MIINWLKRKFQLSCVNTARVDLNRFLDILSGSNDIEMSMIVSAATIIRIKLNKLEKVDNHVFSIGCDVVTQSQTLLFLSRLLRELQNNKQFFEASGMMVWIHTVRSLLCPELRLLGRQMWKELMKGFPFVEQTLLITIEQDLGMDVPKEAYTEYDFIPIGLEPL